MDYQQGVAEEPVAAVEVVLVATAEVVLVVEGYCSAESYWVVALVVDCCQMVHSNSRSKSSPSHNLMGLTVKVVEHNYYYFHQCGYMNTHLKPMSTRLGNLRLAVCSQGYLPLEVWFLDLDCKNKHSDSSTSLKDS